MRRGFPAERASMAAPNAPRPGFSPRFLAPVAKPWLDWRKIHIHCPAGEWHIRREGKLTSKHWKSGQRSSPPATWATPPCSRNFATRFRPTKRSPVSPPPLVVCMQTVRGAARGAAAIIPPRKNAKPWKPDTPGAVARNEALRASKRFGRMIWRRWSGYHRRSRVETNPLMVCRQTIAGQCMARDFDRQVAEFQVRVAVLNGFTALGIPVTEARA